VYKPQAGERPLWDFTEGTLGRREVATYSIAEQLGWGVVPPTVWREDGPLGPGMVQLWIEAVDEPGLVDLVSPGEVPEAWSPIVEGEDSHGSPIVLVHSADPDLERIAALDAIVNNADRKGGHLLRDGAGQVWAIDHGVTLAGEDKLRTVLWGWAGRPIRPDLLADMALLERAWETGLPTDVMAALDPLEITELRRRLTGLVTNGLMPVPGGEWPVLPWPVF
jgi:uncharacterized repeat protein (TIGR03843 family)